MKKLLLLLALAGGATALAAMQVVGSSPDAASKAAADVREARACAALLKRMTRPTNADNWRNRMRLWPCLRRADGAVVASMEADR